MIQVQGLTRRYGDTVAVSGLSFSVQEGEIVGFLGPNGAGKTTTMNMITGCLRPTAGTAVLGGFDIDTDADQARKMIGYLPENPPLYPDMTVSEYLEFVYALKKCTLPKDEHLAQVCGMTGLTEVSGRLIRNLSKGYRQRVAVTQLLVGEPEILILDEPTVGLDPRQIREFRDLLSDLSKEHTIILSSHILSEISSVCSRILVFCEGMLIADGQPQQLQEQLSGCRMLEVEISGDTEGVCALLRGIPEVLAVKGDGNGTYQVSHRAGTDIRSSLYRALRATDYDLLMMKPEEVSLESLYLRITENEQETTES